MKKPGKENLDDDLRPEYDLSKLKGGVRGKYARRSSSKTTLITLASDLTPYFPNDRAVNNALRALVTVAKTQVSRGA